jgi:urease accessory protein
MYTSAEPHSPPIFSTVGLPLLRLLQLVSPALPIGMYSYSQGQEKAVEDGWLNDEAAVAEWLEGLLECCIARTDVPVLARLYGAWADEDEARVARWSAYLRACRETEELRLEDRQTGQALARVLGGLGIAQADAWLSNLAKIS